MPAGYDSTDIEVPDGHYAHMFCDDVSEMYLSFIAPPSRARTNAIAIEFTRAECLAFAAFRRIDRIENKGCRGPTELPPGREVLLPAASPYASPDLKLWQLGSHWELGR